MLSDFLLFYSDSNLSISLESWFGNFQQIHPTDPTCRSVLKSSTDALLLNVSSRFLSETPLLTSSLNG
jgi:hypothetical protein